MITLMSSPFEYIPSELHLSVCVLTGILGFLLVIGVSSANYLPKEQTPPKIVLTKVKIEVPQTDDTTVETDSLSSPTKPIEDSPTKVQTPSRSTPKRPIRLVRNDAYGSVSTPAGRRSARIAKSAKKDYTPSKY